MPDVRSIVSSPIPRDPAAGATPASASTLELSVTGMTCAACATRIERALNRLPGVHAQVNLATETAAVGFDARQDTASVLAAITRTGYGARVHSDPADDRAIDAARKAADLGQLKRDFLVAAVLTAPLLVAMWPMLAGGIHMPAAMAARAVVEDVIPRGWQLLLAAPVQFWAGRRFYIGAWHALRGGSADMDVLIALGTTIAFMFSAIVVIANLAGQHVYFEASSAVITLVLLGKLLETRSRARTSVALEALIRLAPSHARVARGGEWREIPIEDVMVGDTLVIRPGEAVPVDGEVSEGVSQVDESMLTGESMPVDKRPSMRVYAGTINQQGMLTAVAQRVGTSTRLASIVRQVAFAQGSRAPVAKLADRVAGVFVPVVLVIAALTFAATWAIAGDLANALVSAVAVLVIACPCALGLATPTAIVVGTGRAAQLGILLRNAAALERAARITRIAVDKTGTLTEGHPAVVDMLVVGGQLRGDALRIAAGMANASTHPLSRAIAQFASGEGISPVALRDVSDVPGQGVVATLDGGKIATLGSLERFAPSAETSGAIGAWHAQGRTVVALGIDGRLSTVFALADPLRPSSAGALARLQADGIRLTMLTGDHPSTAASVAAAVGIDDVRAQLSPTQKLDAINAMKSDGAVVGMVGDGINDAAALAAADVSFAMASGSDIAAQAADVTIVRDDLNGVADAIELSRATLRKVHQNLFFAFAYNVLGIPLAAFGMLDPMIAGAAMALSSVSVVANALLLRRFEPSWRR